LKAEFLGFGTHLQGSNELSAVHAVR
jgi:hypothetical protein